MTERDDEAGLHQDLARGVLVSAVQGRSRRQRIAERLPDAAGVLEEDTPIVTCQYLPHQDNQVRPDDGALDIGAFERE